LNYFFLLAFHGLSHSYLIFVSLSNIKKVSFCDIDKHLFFELIIIYIFIFDLFTIVTCFFNYIVKLIVFIEPS